MWYIVIVVEICQSTRSFFTRSFFTRRFLTQEDNGLSSWLINLQNGKIWSREREAHVSGWLGLKQYSFDQVIILSGSLLPVLTGRLKPSCIPNGYKWQSSPSGNLSTDHRWSCCAFGKAKQVTPPDWPSRAQIWPKIILATFICL